MSRILLLSIALAALTACPQAAPGDPSLPGTIFGHCAYLDAMSSAEQCKELRGDGWTDTLASEECARNDVAWSTGACPFPEEEQLGACLLTRDADRVVRTLVRGTDPSTCNVTQNGCEVFGGGDWVPALVCGGDVDLDDVYDPDNFAVPPYETCVEPLDGVPGQSADGKVCTLTLIGACTEEGRSYSDYGTCADVRTQQPYYPASPGSRAGDDDPRLDDPAYVEELNWVRDQANACACACCHSDQAPDGPSIWNTDAEGNWINTFTDFGIAFGAAVVDSSLLGSFGPGENNGFTRMVAGIPSTDEARMKAFFEGEMAWRGIDPADFADVGRIPAPFDVQDNFVPAPCEEGEGITDSGALSWTGGRARYLYVLEEGAPNPGVPPNRDLPEGTLWRVDTVPPAAPMKTGEVTYGEVPTGTRQVYPVDDAAPSTLISGETYLLYVQTDLMLPSTRCLFVAP
jgi:hypothetical protein